MDLADIYKLMKILFIISTIFATFSISANPKVYFINLEDGDRVESPFLIQFGLSGKGIAPAGIDVDNTGHHHLLINVDEVNYSMPIPSSKQHLHFGLGQTETKLSLPPGRHKLQLILGDKYHVPHDPPLVSEIIEVNVIE